MSAPKEPQKSDRTQLVVFGVGANLGDRLASLIAAAKALSEVTGLEVAGRSSVYESEPDGGPPQPDYLNAAVSVRTALSPVELLERALEIERRLGRRRPDTVRWGPRTIDIDLLWMSRGSFDGPGLTVPHPRLCDRPFALIPLLELVPDATDPVSGIGYRTRPAAQARLSPIATL
jgi:2-amino-4-hydroxy-6-hydroxymethyldihydropteridine diphosphokinase